MGQMPGTAWGIGSRPHYVVMCHHGGRSQQVALFLASRGYGQVANLAGGIDAWATELDPNLPRY